MRQQTNTEERWNALTHGIAAIFGVLGLIVMCIKVDVDQSWGLFSVMVYGLSLVILFTASTLYHYVRSEACKHYFRIVDHISIYLLIAGTYTPVLLLLLSDSLGWTLFWIIWGIAVFGLVLKLFFTGKFEIFSTLLYLVMGWLIVFDFTNLSNAMDPLGIAWLYAGGLFYTVGIVFYVIQKIPFNHVIWHLFVMGGAFCHFMMIYFYVL
ncbi:PAQR family membrane homeostasis protein TrhA [Winogradskyella aurantiaca]|uniref:PAQR family membrane homeostasis protein TrhA n=1 Tax=Winogradskyella aurantiaca TaxID=2219558 RepID=UPI000E1D7F97|nr:hemolysin III family protein [Winogradskyella aurantiaca]